MPSYFFLGGFVEGWSNSAIVTWLLSIILVNISLVAYKFVDTAYGLCPFDPTYHQQPWQIVKQNKKLAYVFRLNHNAMFDFEPKELRETLPSPLYNVKHLKAIIVIPPPSTKYEIGEHWGINI